MVRRRGQQAKVSNTRLLIGIYQWGYLILFATSTVFALRTSTSEQVANSQCLPLKRLIGTAVDQFNLAICFRIATSGWSYGLITLTLYVQQQFKMLRQVCRRFSTGGRQLMAAHQTGSSGTTGSTSSGSGGPNIPAILAGLGAGVAFYYVYQNFYAGKYSAGPTHVPEGMKTKSGPMDTKYVKNEHDNTKADTGPNYIASSNTYGKTDGSDTRYTVDQGTSRPRS